MTEPAMMGIVEQRNIDAIADPLVKEYNKSFTKKINDKFNSNLEFNTKIDEDYPSRENSGTTTNKNNVDKNAHNHENNTDGKILSPRDF